MAVSPRLELRQTQKTAMTQELRQAIGLLRLNSQELREFVEAEVLLNPFLDVEPARSGADIAEVRSAGNVPLRMGLGSPTGPEQAAPELGLRESLLGQLRMMDDNPVLLSIAARLVEELDDDGLLRVDLREISLALEQPPKQVEAALRLVQMCEPTGVGARTVTECFGLQLREMGELTTLSTDVLTRLSLFRDKGAEAVASAIGATIEDVEAVLMLVRTLDPAPGHSVQPEPVQLAVPDVSVARDNLGGWSVELLTDFQPQLKVNTQIAKAASGAGEAAAEYVSRHTRRANWLLRSLEQRSQTIFRVANEIVRIQTKFFELGPSGLQPLTLKAVAENLNIHESTVSRVTRGKYLVCERGTFELKHFFSKALAGLDGRGDRSALAVRDRIRQLIAGEPESQPLSDDAIAASLKSEGIEIARRTVAKYREAMGIPASHARRRRRRKDSAILVHTAGRHR